MSISKSELGSRLVQYMKNNGYHVKWLNAFENGKVYINISINDKSPYPCWNSKNYKNTISGKKRALREFTEQIIKLDPNMYLTRFWIGLQPILQANSTEELDLRLSILGF